MTTAIGCLVLVMWTIMSAALVGVALDIPQPTNGKDDEK